MFIENIQLKQFRSHDNQTFSFNKNINAIVGENAQGKTNILEGIFLLVLTKSFRTNKLINTIGWSNEFATITSNIVQEVENKEKIKLSLNIARSGEKAIKKSLIDGVESKNLDFIGKLNAVIFEPEDLNLATKEPSLRRRYLDMALAQISREYVFSLAKYLKIMKIRNKLLYNIRENLSVIDELTYWDEQILNFGARIIHDRKELINSYNKKLGSLYKEISGTDQELSILYESKIRSTSEDEIRNELREMFEISRFEDINYGQTSTGPHRDDMSFNLDGKNIKTFASRGEVRSIIISLKLAEMNFIEEKTSKKPILLLDDVFSELDKNRRKQLLQYVQDRQVILTTTDIEHLSDFEEGEVNVIKI